MIQAATIRAQVSQIEKFNTAINSFKIKYGALPGDLSPGLATAFGFITRAGTQGHGDNNGLIEAGPPGGGEAAGEIAMFWRDLGDANMIEGVFLGVDCVQTGSGCTASVPYTTTPMSSIVPSAKLSGNSYVTVYATAGKNHYQIIGSSDIKIATTGCFCGAPNQLSQTPLEAFAIDSKIDDGYPGTGAIFSSSYNRLWTAVVGPGDVGAASAGQCGNTDVTPTGYNIGSTYGNSRICSISIRFQ